MVRENISFLEKNRGNLNSNLIELIQLFKNGFDIILIGHKDHPEVVGTMGQLPTGSVKLIETVEDVASLRVEDFTKPLSLSFRLFGNVLADELTISVLTALVPLIIPLPIMLLGIFAGSVQALIFSTLAAAYIAEALE